ncbi:E3 ubiquitin-protein ligase MARCH5-like [Myzus persicae]|uniref:E3 ubiquitin-protein ligase MARCH5-like n=1 Tax=Myzus persicae TaxID=13164 RepID=UPI000B930A8C|nr:E3 ubiquitin-protein ligase MARCH5-like [Myzus persicae]
MENSNIGQHDVSSYSQDTSEPKRCWVCFGTNDDDNESNSDWVSPCKCRGSSRWVHQDCVQRWVEEKQKENLSVKVHCPQCHTQYIIVYGEVNYFVRVLNNLDKLTNLVCTFLATGIVINSLYWSAVYYGATTLMQVMGNTEAVKMMVNINSHFPLQLVLPLIPLSLFLSNLVNWEVTLLLFVQRLTLQQPLLRTIMPSFLLEPVNSSTSSVQLISDTHPKITICAALLLPTIATNVGHLLFDKSSYSSLQKTLLGGLVYVAVKGVIRIYQRQHNVIKRRTLKVIHYPESNTDENN